MSVIDLDLDHVKGFLPEEEGMHLYELAREASRLGPCLEIGSYCGKSAVYIATGCRENGSVLFSIDHHRGSEEHQPGEEYHDRELFDPDIGVMDSFKAFRKTIAEAGLEENVVPIVARSEVVARCWETPLGMVFIDGGHSLDAALILGLPPQLLEKLESYRDQLRSVFIVSSVSLESSEAVQGGIESEEVPGLKVLVEPSPDPKCERCWVHDPSVGNDAGHPTICRRCIKALEEMESESS